MQRVVNGGSHGKSLRSAWPTPSAKLTRNQQGQILGTWLQQESGRPASRKGGRDVVTPRTARSHLLQLSDLLSFLTKQMLMPNHYFRGPGGKALLRRYYRLWSSEKDKGR